MVRVQIIHKGLSAPLFKLWTNHQSCYTFTFECIWLGHMQTHTKTHTHARTCTHTHTGTIYVMAIKSDPFTCAEITTLKRCRDCFFISNKCLLGWCIFSYFGQQPSLLITHLNAMFCFLNLKVHQCYVFNDVFQRTCLYIVASCYLNPMNSAGHGYFLYDELCISLHLFSFVVGWIYDHMCVFLAFKYWQYSVESTFLIKLIFRK